MVNLPNKITLLRIAAIPVFLVVLSINIKYKEIFAVAIFVLIALSDSLDGYIARKRKQISDAGKIIDPLADKLLISAALIFLIGQGVEAWMAFVIIAREFLVLGLRVLVMGKKTVIAASNLGKIKTILQVVAVVAVLINSEYAWYIMLIAVIFTVWSGADYFISARRFLKQALE